MPTRSDTPAPEVLASHYAIQVHAGDWRTVATIDEPDPGETLEQTTAWCLAEIREYHPSQVFRVVQVVTQQRVIDDTYLHARPGRKGA